MSIQPTTSAVETIKLIDFDFDFSKKDHVAVTCEPYDGCVISLAAHWDIFLQWACEKYDFSGYNVALRTVEVMEPVGQSYGDGEYDEAPFTYDAQEKLSELGFSDAEQIAFFNFMMNEAFPKEIFS